MFGRRRMLDTLDAEMREHIELETQENESRGMSPREARQAALRKFGNVALAKEDTRAVWIPVWLEQLLQDVRYGTRILARNPGFAAVAIVSLALGIGGNAVIFGFVDGFVFRPFPFRDPDRVVGVGVTFPRLSDEELFVETFSPAEFRDIAESRSIQHFAAFDLGNRNISGGDRPERVFTGLALTDPFGPFGLLPALGRGFTPDELAPGGPPVAILSYRLWRSRFGGDGSIVGRAVRVNDVPRTVVGVMPPELLIMGADLWIPWGADPATVPRNVRQFTLIGRLAPEATLEQANAELATIARRIGEAHGAQFKEYAGWRLSVTPWAAALMRDFRPVAIMLLGSVGLLLLIACANVANLLLARSTSRQNEIAVRVAIGAGSARIARQLVTEVIVLASIGCAIGLVLAAPGLRAAIGLVPVDLNFLGLAATINTRVVAYSAALALGAAVLAALFPVFQSVRTNPNESLRTDGRRLSAGRGPHRTRQTLIVGEIALSLLLLCCAGLLVRSFVKLRQVEPGFDPRNLLTLRITLPAEKYRGQAINDFFASLVDRMSQAPGVRAVSIASQFPPSSTLSTQFRLEGADASDAVPNAAITVASETYFSTLGVPMVGGRLFTDFDRPDGPPVAIINEAFASRFLPGGNPVGRRLRTGPPDRLSDPIEIVGVAANTKNRGVRVTTAPELFIPLRQQRFNNQLFLIVRTNGEAAAILPTVRQQIAVADKELPIYAIQTMEDAFAAAGFQQRLSMILLGLFAGAGLILAAIGTYGVISYAVSAQTKEIGVRIVLGADRSVILGMVIGQGARVVGAGALVGLLAALLGARAIRTYLFAVAPTDPATFAVVLLVVVLAGFIASIIPARRATAVDPLEALRAE